MKVINSFTLDTKNIKAGGETRTLSVAGESGAVFSLEIKSGDNYYNFQTNLFQVARTRLSNVNLGDRIFNENVKFPSISAGAKYDIYLTAEGDTKHSDYKEVRFDDGSMDINSTTGSNSRLVQKEIYQTLDVTVTINGYSPNNTVTGTNTTSATISTSREKGIAKIPFTYTFAVASTKTLSINKQPISGDVMAFIVATVGSPVDIPGENIYPVITGVDTVNGDYVGVTKLVMDADVATKMSVGDRVTGIDIPSSSVVTVVALNPDGDNVKEFSVSEAVTIGDGVALSFSNRRNYRWEMSSTSVDLSRLAPGMKQVQSTFFGSQPTVKDYVDEVVVFEGETNQKNIEKIRVPGVDTRDIRPLIVRDGTTKVVTTTVGSSTNPIHITFNQQALLSFGGGANAKIFSYGVSEINRLTDYDVEFSDLAVSLAGVSTTTTAAVNASTSVPILERAGIMDDISTVSGIGIDASVANPTVASGAGSVIGAGTIVLSTAQTLEDGITLTFPGAGTVATITGNIKINNVGNEDVTLRFDLEKFLTMR
tara:strand:- start:665 stop:2278 length:1614 start_codon:yes stop_codon:yes gene_type:complete